MGETGAADTLGVLVDEVTAEGPAAKAGLMATTAAAPRAGMGQMMRSNTKTDRAALGVQLGGSPSKRDTLGVLVIAVNADGPAEKAGIIEGDRIARINGVDLRVPGVDAGDAELSQARVSRLHSEMAKLEPGAVATLTMVTAGRSREVRVTTAKSSEMGGAATYFFNDGQLNALRELPALIEGVRMPLLERQIEGRRRVEEEQVWSRESLQRSKEAMKRAEEALQRARIVVPGRRVIVV
jgi:predicted metalloprotease with PDZ domain